ncbi:MAG: NAD(P)/FAD-dependent oxidoreductase [bacterium]|nr:NAD(P)/FAD-dependent oxidoreductase [bacterium]
MNSYDVVVIGGGAAGLSAALVLTRARRSVVVIDAGKPRNGPAAHMQGYLSRDGLPPHDLLVIGHQEVRSYGGEIVSGTVVALSRLNATMFTVELATGERLTARRVLLTTGLLDELPDIPGLDKRWGRDLLHCPYCHGYEVRDHRVGVLGGTPDAVQHALLIRQWSPDVVYFPHTDILTPEQSLQLEALAVGVVHGHVSGLVVTDDVVHGVELENGRVVARDVVFVRPRLVPNSDLLRSLDCAVDDGGWVTVDAVGMTRTPGVWAAGNASNPRAQVITAAGEGSAAAIAINADLVNEDIARAVERHLGAGRN